MLHATNYLFGMIRSRISENTFKCRPFAFASSVLDVKVDVVRVGRINYGLKHMKAHLVIPIVVILLVCSVVEQTLVRDENASEMEIVVIEKVIYQVLIESQFG